MAFCVRMSRATQKVSRTKVLLPDLAVEEVDLGLCKEEVNSAGNSRSSDWNMLDVLLSSLSDSSTLAANVAKFALNITLSGLAS